MHNRTNDRGYYDMTKMLSKKLIFRDWNELGKNVIFKSQSCLHKRKKSLVACTVENRQKKNISELPK